MTKWTIPQDELKHLPSQRMKAMTDRIEALEAEVAQLKKMLSLAEGMHKDTFNGAQGVIDKLGAALRQIISEAPSLQYAQGIARDALYPKDQLK